MSTKAVANYIPHRRMYNGAPGRRVSDPTRTLPAEILERIFMHLKCTDINPAIDSQGFKSAWIRVTWVCRRWREIAIQHSALWAPTLIKERAQASHDPFDAARVLLARALPRPLDLIVTPQHNLEVVRAYAHRVKYLHIEILPEDYDDISPEEAFRALPALGTMLTHLFIKSEPGQSVTLYATAFPMLRSLAFSHAAVKVVGTMTNVESLTAGDLAELPYSNSGHLWLHQDLKDLLRATPNVKAITFDNAIPERAWMESHPLTDFTPVSLPRLRHVELKELAQDIGPLFHLITVPPEARLIIKGTYLQCVPPESVPTKKLLWFPRGLLPFTTLGPNAFLGIIVDPLGHIHLRKDINASGPSQGLPVVPRHWDISVTDLVDKHEFSHADGLKFLGTCCGAVLHELLSIVPPTQLHILRLEIPSVIPVSHNWARWLQPFTNVAELVLVGSALTRGVIQALESDIRLLPSLKNIALLLDTPESTPSASALGRWLQGRAQCGKGLARLGIAPAMPEANTRTMASVVQRLIGYAAGHVQMVQSPYTGNLMAQGARPRA
ncbi:hypothetical protein C8Q73DRAFT_788857 [Cubamyces lactineus]|nr:hypothetical protein C8Q73DRAFT_788857 [Cubamyces lactineus]